LFAALALVAYLVQPGDTLSGIAASHSASLAAVEAANPQLSDPNLIYAGQTV
jgi:LysM repeat protein